MSSVTGSQRRDEALVDPLPAPKRQRLTVKTNRVGHAALTRSASQERLDSPRRRVPKFTRDRPLDPAAMTVVCSDQNMRGGFLLRTVHNVIQEYYDGAIDMACEYEKDIGGAILNPPEYKRGVIRPRSVTDWVFTLGGWKGMMPKEEVPAYFFDDKVVAMNFGKAPGNPKYVPKFRGVEIGGVTFPIRSHRLHFPGQFKIGSFNVTGHYYQGTKTDLSYAQINRAINSIKQQFGLSDGDLARFQLGLFYGASGFRDDNAIDRVRQLADVNLRSAKLILLERWGWVRLKDSTAKTRLEQMRTFFDYLNALMFGIEPSGLNAGFLIGLMTLELVANGHLTYEQAFHTNDSGGVYPYATWGGSNKGTFVAREALLAGSPSMREYRADASLSPVAVKEAMLIRLWYAKTGHYDRNETHATASQKLAQAAKALVHANQRGGLVDEWFGLSGH